MEDVHHRQPDGTMIYGKAWRSGSETCVLVIPDVGQTLLHSYHDRLCEHLADDVDVVALELRGHRLSTGKWSLHSYRADVTYWIAHFTSLYEKLYVVATGFSASTMLEYDDQAHQFPRDLPPLPDGMVLLNPAFTGLDVLPEHGRLHHAVRKVANRRTVERKLRELDVRFEDPVLFWEEMERYELSPVRIQTPTVVFAAGDLLADPLKKVFGNVTLEKLGWLHHGSNASIAKHISDVKKSLQRVMSSEEPHRFRAVR